MPETLNNFTILYHKAEINKSFQKNMHSQACPKTFTFFVV